MERPAVLGAGVAFGGLRGRVAGGERKRGVAVRQQPVILGPAPDDEPRQWGEDDELDDAKDGPARPPRGLLYEDGEQRHHREAEHRSSAARPCERCRSASDEPVGDGGARADVLQPRSRCSNAHAEEEIELPRRLHQREQYEARAAEQRARRHADARSVSVEDRPHHHAERGGYECRDGEGSDERGAAPSEVVLHGDDEQAEEVARCRAVREQREEGDAHDPPPVERGVEPDAADAGRGAHGRRYVPESVIAVTPPTMRAVDPAFAAMAPRVVTSPSAPRQMSASDVL